MASKTWSSAAMPAARSARCMRTALERKRSRVPAADLINARAVSGLPHRRREPLGTCRSKPSLGSAEQRPQPDQPEELRKMPGAAAVHFGWLVGFICRCPPLGVRLERQGRAQSSEPDELLRSGLGGLTSSL
jgi:hypothetical protein